LKALPAAIRQAHNQKKYAEAAGYEMEIRFKRIATSKKVPWGLKNNKGAG
jgi:hypothetical protein